MNLPHILQDLLGRGSQHPQSQGQAARGVASSLGTAANSLVAGRQPMPGYHNQAVQYEQAMQNGNFNSPIAHMDPKFFGYPAEAPQFSHQQGIGAFAQGNPGGGFGNIYQGGKFNPGLTPYQGGNLNYRNAPQPATFNSPQQGGNDPQQGAIFY